MLNLRFSTTAGKVAISCNEERSDALQVLRRHFHSATSLSNVEFETELDDFLVNLRQLAAWAEFDTDFRCVAEEGR